MAHVPSKLRKKIEWLFRRAEGALLPDAVRAEEAAFLDPDGARLALRVAIDEVDIAGATARLDHLVRAETDPDELSAYKSRYGVVGTQRHLTLDDRVRIYQMSVETFPRHVNNVYLVLEGDHALLLDAGSGMPSSKRDLALAFAAIRSLWQEDVLWDDIDMCVVSHAHSDHCGGVNEIRKTTRAKLLVHELDARVISAFEERLVLATKDIDVYWKRAGLTAKEREDLRELYSFGKRLFHSERVDQTLRDGDLIGPGYRVHHVPGHCPGLICLQVHDVLLTSDHVLARITPHQFPQAITPFAGLEHYFQSLEKVRKLEGIRFALGGHEEPILDLRARIDEIASFHRTRLERVLDICAAPLTVNEIAQAMFGEQEGYGVILAIDEAGAHVEFLHALGRLRVDNLDEVALADEPVLRYVKRSDAA